MKPLLSLIVAMGENAVIGREGQLPWRQKSDLAHFRRMTLGKPVVMGRKTYESIGRPLPGRKNIVLTSDPAWRPEAAASDANAPLSVVHSLEAALAKAEADAVATGQKEVMIIGGKSLYEATLPLADRIYLTIVHAEPEGDTLMPEIDSARFRDVQAQRHEAGAGDDHAFTLKLLERVAE